jgi:hypothetical protein
MPWETQTSQNIYFVSGYKRNIFDSAGETSRRWGVVNGHECERNILMCESNLFTLHCCVCVRVWSPPLRRQLRAEKTGFVGQLIWFAGCIAELGYRKVSAHVKLYFASFSFNSFLHAYWIVNIKMYKTVILFSFCCILLCKYLTKTKKLNSVAWVRERTIPIERPPLVGEVSANFWE